MQRVLLPSDLLADPAFQPSVERRAGRITTSSAHMWLAD